MEAIASINPLSFGQQHFGNCDLGDKRLTERLVITGNLFFQHPGGTLPDKLNRNADLIGFYRLVNNPKATHTNVLAGHTARTRDLIAQSAGDVLILHDTTELDYDGLESVKGLGQIGNGTHRGFLCHNSLAYDYETGEVLGLVGQLIHVRREVPKGESPTAKRDHPQRESRLWKKGWKALGPMPANVRLIHITDRGGDVLEFTEAVDHAGEYYCVRSKTNRNIELQEQQGNAIKARLHDFARALPAAGTRTVKVSSNKGQKGRKATVSVAAAPVTIRTPHFARGEHSKENLATWVVCVREINPPKGETPLEWILLTNVAATTFEQMCERVDWYACRIVIEEYHKAQKTGCGIELPQFTTAHALQVAIAVLSVVGTQLLRLRDLSRREDATTRPASEVIDTEYVAAVSYWRHKTVKLDMSIHDFCRALAKLGGHLNRKHDGPPGWLVLWRGWTKLQLMVDGLIAARTMRCV